jgi:CheY-like chemotaxis protein
MANILVVDDDVPFVKAQAEFLRRSGHTVSTAANGKEAMDLVARDDFDLVITDLNMPEKEGLETIAELRRTVPKIKIIAMSGGTVMIGAKDSLSMAQMFGASFTLAKPFSGQTLITAITQVLSH